MAIADFRGVKQVFYGGDEISEVYAAGQRIWKKPPESFEPVLVTISEVGPFTVTSPLGSTSVDVVWCGGGAGGGHGFAGVSGVPTPTDGSETKISYGPTTYTAAGGVVGKSPDVFGESPGDKTFNNRLYPGGTGGSGTFNGTATDGTTPGAGGGGASGSNGGGAGKWSATTFPTNGGTTFTGTVGDGGNGAASATYGTSGDGARGVVHFYFYSIVSN